VRDALERHLRYEPTRVSKSRIKRLRGLSQPQYRRRVGEVRVFYDVTQERPAGSPSTGRRVRQAALAEVKDDLSRYLRLTESEEILITRHGKPAGVLIGFESEDDWFDYRLEHHPEFLQRVAAARQALREARGIRLKDLLS
jgi:prevent-host-death family protein